MATHKSAIKRAKQSELRRQRNRVRKTRVKGAVKKVRVALESKSVEEAHAALREAIPIIDKAASKGALHHRTAARRIARLSKKIHTLSVGQE